MHTRYTVTDVDTDEQIASNVNSETAIDRLCEHIASIVSMTVDNCDENETMRFMFKYHHDTGNIDLYYYTGLIAVAYVEQDVAPVDYSYVNLCVL